MPTHSLQRTQRSRSLFGASACIVLGCVCVAASLQTTLGIEAIANSMMSDGLWKRLVSVLGASVTRNDFGDGIADVPYAPLLGIVSAVAALAWLGGGVLLSFWRRESFTAALAEWGVLGWRWWLLAGLWELLWSVAGVPKLGLDLYVYAFVFAGWLSTFFALGAVPGETGFSADAPNLSQRIPATVWLAGTMYFLVLAVMNWQLYRGLLIPHGDSAMYEEHLWNVLHGKGFRSYLDQGLFLGEHVQVIHLLLIPVYLLFPSHLLLETCSSLFLAAGVFPIYWMAQRHTDSRKVGSLLAVAYVLYFPLQFLDIAVDLKTFRPISLGVPVLLFALDQLERGRYKTFVLLLLVALSAKEDFAMVLAPLGVWIAIFQPAWIRRSKPVSASDSDPTAPTASAALGTTGIRWFGIGLVVVATLYLILVTRAVIPFFRQGEEVHYARYFEAFGKSLDEIAINIVTKPSLLLAHLATLKMVHFFLAFVLSLGFIPLRSLGRLLVGMPIFITLCLNTLSDFPHHHFHAPLVPILFWATAAGLGGHWPWTLTRSMDGDAVAAGEKKRSHVPRMMFAANMTWTSALATSFFLSLTPVGLRFWDPGSNWYWQTLYLPGKRAAEFEKIYPLIPLGSRVASTDFVHTRFTHHERSYDYSDYPRKVSDYELRVPHDTDYIVVDTQHPYSKVKRPEDIREYREHPEQWELLPDKTDGYFIVLKRIRNHDSRETTGAAP